MKTTRDSKCPLCGSGMTDFHYSHSDGESTRRGLFSNICINRDCGLPVKLWEQIERLQSENAALNEGLSKAIRELRIARAMRNLEEGF